MILIAVIVLLTLIILVITTWAYCKVSCGICKCSGHLVGKVVIVTGANSGIGFETAKDFAQRGARVILACRSLERGTSAQQKIIQASGNIDVRLLQLNLESFNSIRKFVDNFNATEKRLDILVNNAGRFSTDDTKTEDGLHAGMQINYFGPFLLTSLLLPLLKKSAPSRIINVTSFVYHLGSVDFHNLNNESGTLNSFKMYRNSKLFTVLMTVELNRKLLNTGVTVNCLHPGVVNSNMVENLEIYFVRFLLKMFITFFKSPWEGAQTSIYLAVSNEVEKLSGSYFKDCHLSAYSSKARDLVVAQKLWDITEKIVELK